MIFIGFRANPFTQTQMVDVASYQRYIVDRMDEAGGFTFVFFDELYEQWRSDEILPQLFNEDRMKLYCIRRPSGFEYVAVDPYGQEFPYPEKPLESVKEAIQESTTLGWGALTYVTVDGPCDIQEVSTEWRQEKMYEINLAHRAAYNNYMANESIELTALVQQALANAVEVIAAEDAVEIDESHLLLPFTPKQKQVEARVERVMIEKAVSEGLACSITLTPLTATTAACVAPCYHVFDREAIRTWLATKNTCPECRRICSL